MESIFLLSHLATNNNVGIIGAKRLLTYEFLKSIMKDNIEEDWDTPYYIKRVYLRYLYEVYISQQGDLNIDFKIYKLIDIIEQIVVPELLNFQYNIHGLIQLQYPDYFLNKDTGSSKINHSIAYKCKKALAEVKAFTNKYLIKSDDIY